MKEKIKIGLIGLGGRGQTLMTPLAKIPELQITIVCDRYEDRVKDAQDKLHKLKCFLPSGTTDYREVLKDPDIKAVIVATSWNEHVQIAEDAMRAGKYVGVEVGGAYDLEDCWRLVRAHEETGVHLMMLENVCYGEKELTVLNMVKKGMFGQIVHCAGGYQHDLRGEITRGRQHRHYRFSNFRRRNGELYPTHELGPIANLLDINRGNRMLTLCSMASAQHGLTAWIKEREPEDSDLHRMSFSQGDVTTTMIRCANGETILLTHDVSLPRPYSRAARVQGTGGIYMEDGNHIFMWEKVKDQCTGDSEEEHSWESFDEYLEEYRHPLWKKYRISGVQEGHGGVDFLVLSAFAESVRENCPPPIDVYDAAAWMSITYLSEQSIAMGSHPVPIPDFTRGNWIEARPRHKSIYSLDAIHEDLFFE